MFSINRSALVEYSARQMFDLVNDVDAYPDFLPWCGGARLVGMAEERTLAAITIAFRGVHKEFTTSNLIVPAERIEMELVDGPFNHLVGDWRFLPLEDNSCKIALSLEFGFSNRLAEKVIGPVFRHISDTMVESFCKRATTIYGTHGSG